ncbi:MAG: adenosylmethionine--8-amino-7-oxononanoate transaminase [Bacteroidetes bacterium RIFCSPLOWO2_12_FULL_35_15]|nr:MAG: adenosylmethionine--8-amino-7-oxononanoate transaminase [Bacteroidetes bacterium RIFCSPLOWO2_12_FULL_35_15]
MTLQERDKKVVWHPFTQIKTAPLPISIVRGDGAYFYDEKGKRYIDGIASWWVNVHGHCHPYLSQKISEQLQTLEHAIFSGFTHEPAVQLAERLLKRLPANQSKIFYSDNGSTAVEVALKMAFQYWSNQSINKTKVIAFENGYHGDTFGGMSVGARNAFNLPFSKLLFDVIHIPVPISGKEQNTLNALNDALKHDDIAAFIFEPMVQGAGGMVMYSAKALDGLIKICKDKNVITIADEVMTGFGRTGKFFASDHLMHKADIICLSKGLTGGVMPLGVTSCAQFIYEAFLSDDKMKTFFHGHSYTANPTACSAALASMDLFDKPEAFENIERIEQQHNLFLQKIRSHKALIDVRQLGTIIAFEIKTKEETNYLNSLSEIISGFFISRGIILRPLGNVLYVLPPYCISNKDLQIIYDAIEEFLNFCREDAKAQR